MDDEYLTKKTQTQTRLKVNNLLLRMNICSPASSNWIKEDVHHHSPENIFDIKVKLRDETLDLIEIYQRYNHICSEFLKSFRSLIADKGISKQKMILSTSIYYFTIKSLCWYFGLKDPDTSILKKLKPNFFARFLLDSINVYRIFQKHTKGKSENEDAVITDEGIRNFIEEIDVETKNAYSDIFPECLPSLNLSNGFPGNLIQDNEKMKPKALKKLKKPNEEPKEKQKEKEKVASPKVLESTRKRKLPTNIFSEYKVIENAFPDTIAHGFLESPQAFREEDEQINKKNKFDFFDDEGGVLFE